MKGSQRVVGAVDTPVPCLVASVADVSKEAGALSVTLTLVVEVVARAGVGAGARRLSAVAVRSLLPCLLLGRRAPNREIAGSVGSAIVKSLVPHLLTVVACSWLNELIMQVLVLQLEVLRAPECHTVCRCKLSLGRHLLPEVDVIAVNHAEPVILVEMCYRYARQAENASARLRKCSTRLAIWGKFPGTRSWSS